MNFKDLPNPCCCCQNDDSFNPEDVTRLYFQIGDNIFKTSGTPTNITLCHNGKPVPYKTWKDNLKKAGVTLSIDIIQALDEATEATLATLLSTTQTCS